MSSQRYQAVLFDMDNTLLQSRIDFSGIKEDVFRLLAKAGLFPDNFPLHEYTIATFLEEAKQTEGMTNELETAAWEIVVNGEREGMIDAALEPFVPEMLEALHRKARLVVLTNNARAAAIEALERTGITHYFEHIAGREQMEALKPSPSGIRYLLSLFPTISPEQWLSVGDSWIDGKAAQDAGIDFLAYNVNSEQLARRQIDSIGSIRSMQQLADYVIG